MTPILLGLTATLLALALLIAMTIVAQREARARALNENDSLFALQAVMRTMLEAESSQRGYVLTGDGDYLPAYARTKDRLGATIAELRRVAARAGDAETSNRINWIVSLTDAKFTEMDRTMALMRAGMQPQAQMIIDSDLGRQQMEAIRATITGESARKADQRRAAFARAETLERRLVPLMAILGLATVALVAAGFRAERNRSTAAAQAAQADALREANERTQLLARELNHRVKNLFSVILAIVTLSARRQGSNRDVVESIRARIHALSLAHATSQGEDNAGVRIGSVIAKTMEPYIDEDGARVRISGPEVDLPARMVTPIGLIIHELATNAVKYGALAADGGSVEIAWQVAESGEGNEVRLSWIERGGPSLSYSPDSPASGFGSQMTALAAQQLGGSISREWPASGAVARLNFPLGRTARPGERKSPETWQV